MKILFLHGAKKNSGDFLISYRSQNLIKSIVPNCELVPFWEGENFDKPENRDILNECDGIVFGGGPFFTNNIYPNDIPLVNDISRLNKPMLNIGGGWFGRDNTVKSIKNYSINDDSLKLLKMIENSSGELSCRDWFTVNMLKEKGFNAVMNGCPAWYDLNYIDKLDFELPKEIKSICVSDPAVLKNTGIAIELIKWLRNKFVNADLKLIYHRGINENSDLFIYAKSNDIEMIDISGGYEKFEIYDTCDLHIGFRVHAHIYNMSHRNFSILIEEDGRGAGVNQAFGLSSVCAYRNWRTDSDLGKKIEYRLFYKNNKDMIDELNMCFDRIYYTNGIDYSQAFQKMRYYYEKMKSHINLISKW